MEEKRYRPFHEGILTWHCSTSCCRAEMALNSQKTCGNSSQPAHSVVDCTRQGRRPGAGLRAGADDYVTKPFHNEELLLRIQSLLKRRDREEGPDRLSLGDFVLDTESFTLNWPSGQQRLTPKEGKVLKLLMQRQGRTTERDLIARMVWGESGYFVGRSMDVYIVRLRKLLKADPQVKLDTIHGVGFRLEAVQKS